MSFQLAPASVVQRIPFPPASQPTSGVSSFIAARAGEAAEKNNAENSTMLMVTLIFGSTENLLRSDIPGESD